MTTPTWIKTTAAVAATAAIGFAATDPSTPWYRGLRKPSWQPPPPAFPAVWTPLYALLAAAGTRALRRTTGKDRARFARTFGANLILNAGWPVLFFRARSPAAAFAEVVALDLTNAMLLRHAAKADRLMVAALTPYAAWTIFATALNAAIVVLNAGQGPVGHGLRRAGVHQRRT
ncbi:TspO/MBR family protein [Micromonospora eburnea]|uniref:TspO and MBR related proteins n=1 Tax=Micromonospora eburnea TaxID=227316 RepID=A0A1C6UZU1_9ACTN|nr:TspO/MBR family protein [Micromonospora eburnea]SCL59542.1 TspO and MBR related proteins [Micromonospora eburnea]